MVRKKIVHLSTAHLRRELRIHLKQCNSLAKIENYDVHFVVADGKGEEQIGDVLVHDIGKSRGRFQRMLIQPWKMLAKARQLKGDSYHFHDPEILLIALFIGKDGAAVIYDSHEDVPRSLLARAWVPSLLRKPLSFTLETFENFIAARLSAIVGATPSIARRFAQVNPNSITINNFPMRNEIDKAFMPRNSSERIICYQGGISEARGIREMVLALEHVDAKLIIAGTFDSQALLNSVSALPGWTKVDYRGQVSREEVRKIMAQSQIGLVLFHPEPNHVEAQPNKMFEYMSAGLPILASDFPLWRELFSETDAGHVVNPLDPKAIAASIEAMLNAPGDRVRMGQNGHQAILDKYVWESQEMILFSLYNSLLD